MHYSAKVLLEKFQNHSKELSEKCRVPNSVTPHSSQKSIQGESRFTKSVPFENKRMEVDVQRCGFNSVNEHSETQLVQLRSRFHYVCYTVLEDMWRSSSEGQNAQL